MKQRATQFLKHPLIYGSGVVVIGGLFANFFNFLFNLFMSRNLSVSDYGVLASVISIVIFPALLASAVSPLVVQFAGNYFALGKLDMVRGLYRKLFIFFSVISVIVLILFLLNLSMIGSFLHIKDTSILIVVSFMIFLMILSVINTAFIQAKLAFGFQASANIVTTIIKFLLGAAFVLAGLSVSGAVYAIFVSVFITYLISFIPLRMIFDRKIATPKINTKELFAYGIPSTITLVSLTSFISTDILLVKHFFDPTEAGIYAGLSLVARVIFYVSAPVATVMFPIIVRKYAKQESITKTFLGAVGLVLLPSILITIFYYIFPDFSILFFLKKTEYLVVTPLLGLFALYMTLYSLLFILSNFYLSLKKTNIYIPVSIGAILQIFLIIFYHNDYLQVILTSLAITFLLVCGLLIYYPYATKK